MLVAKVFVFLITAIGADQACTSESCAERFDDVTALLQAHASLSPGSSRANVKVEAAPSEETETTQAKAMTASEVLSWLKLPGGNILDHSEGVHKGFAEFVAMVLFVFIGCGSAMAVCKQPGWLFQVSLTFGFAISALAYSIGHISGGQINCAVTLGLVMADKLEMKQALINLVAQLAGAVVGSMLTCAIFSEDMDLTKGLGTNAVSEGFSWLQALLAEFMGTFLLVFVVLETAINEATLPNRPLACMAIGIAVFLAHSVMIPIDGCSINPSRSFGPMVVKKLFRSGKDDPETLPKYIAEHWIFWVGPLAGATAAALVYNFLH